MVAPLQPKNWQRTIGLAAVLVGMMVSAVVSNGKREPTRLQSQRRPLPSPAVDLWMAQAGGTELQGPGIEIELSDSQRRPAAGEDPHFYIVHDCDLQTLVNELWASQCEGISINRQRIGPRTPIRCVGPTILVNTTRIEAPYLIKALGSPGDLENALRMSGGWVDGTQMLIRSGGRIKISRSKRLILPAFKGSQPFLYATPAP